MRKKKKEIKLAPDELPYNRYKQLAWVFRRHFFELAGCSLLMGLFALPSAAWVVLSSSGAFFDQKYLANVLLVYGILSVLLSIFGLGAAGGTYFFHQLSWNNGASLLDDFFAGIRKNGKRFALMGFFFGIVYLLIHLLIYFSNLDEALNAYLKAASIGISYAVLFLLFCVFAVLGPLETTYEGTALKNFTIALRISLANLYKWVWIFLLCALPFALFEFIGNVYLAFGVFIVCAAFYFGFACLLCVLYSNHLFDIAFNRKQYASAYRKGLVGEGDVSFPPQKK